MAKRREDLEEQTRDSRERAFNSGGNANYDGTGDAGAPSGQQTNASILRDSESNKAVQQPNN